MLVFGVVSSQTQEAFELLPTREQAEGFIAEVEADKPDLADCLSVEEIVLLLTQN